MIRLGIDFDNTLIIYDALFKKAALEKNLIPINFPECKNSIRDYLRERDQEKLFTTLQGEIYGSRIFEASPAEGMYVILDGQVSIIDPDSETIFATLESGDFFGELALLDEEPRSASAVAKIPSRLIGFFRTDLLTLMKRSPELGNKILINLSRVLGERLRRTNQELAKPNH